MSVSDTIKQFHHDNKNWNWTNFRRLGLLGFEDFSEFMGYFLKYFFAGNPLLMIFILKSLEKVTIMSKYIFF
jgi:hypothetical protein